MVFGQNQKLLTPAKKDAKKMPSEKKLKIWTWGGRGGGVSSERASQEEQNGANFSLIAPSDEELRVCKDIWSKWLTIVHGFWPESTVLLSKRATFFFFVDLQS